jgi:hypothetical protein
MKDDEKLGLSQNKIEVVIAEVKRNEPCKLDGPWTDKSRKARFGGNGLPPS